MELIRPAANRGKFYPYKAADILAMIKHWNEILDQAENYPATLRPLSIISPHAGYVYSGFTANAAHRLLGNRAPAQVLVVGPSHHVYFRGMSMGPFTGYETPFGTVEAATELYEELHVFPGMNYAPKAHLVEHSTETQFPFLAHYTQASILELIYGDVPYTELVPVLLKALQTPGTAVVISTDLSHYYDQDKANRLDAACLEGVRLGDLQLLASPCEACGKIGLMAMVEAAHRLGLKPHLIDYRTSGDITGDYSAVVGYMSAAYTKD